MPHHNHIYELIEYSLHTFSDSTACCDLEQSWTYSELSDSIQRFRELLLVEGIGNQDILCVCMPKSNDSLALLLTVLSLNACVLPVAHNTPLSRLKDIIEDAQPSAIVGSKQLLTDLSIKSNEQDCSMVSLGENGYCFQALNRRSVRNTLSDLSYLLYTSGSTGVPKGVMITNRNVLSFIEWASDTFDFASSDIFASIAPFHFDLSIFDIFVSLSHGGKIVLFDDQHVRNPLLLSSMIDQHKITSWYSTPTLLTLIDLYGKLHKFDHSSLRKVFYAGEVFPVKHLISIKEKWPGADFFNFYGPTETNVCTWVKIPDHLDHTYDTALIGKACDHSLVSVGTDGDIVKPIEGVEGELLVSGLTMSPGYMNEDDDNQFKDENGTTWYKTGDQVRVDSNLNLIFLGRKDRMVKRKGYRIELDEIQKSFEKLPEITRAGVISTQDKNRSILIRAFYEYDVGSGDVQEIRDQLSTLIPDYMMPDQMQQVDELPLTNTHKIDYQALTNIPMS